MLSKLDLYPKKEKKKDMEAYSSPLKEQFVCQLLVS